MNKIFLVTLLFVGLLSGCTPNNSTKEAQVVVPVVDTQAAAKNVEAAAGEVSQAAEVATTQVTSMVQSAADAIKDSVNKGSIQQQIDYLLEQAKNFVGAEKYDQVALIANQILSKLDPNSAKAKEFLQMAQSHLGDKAKQVVGDVKNQISSFMKQ